MGWGALAGAAVGALGSYLGGRDRNRDSKRASAAQMQFQERMSNTAYQRSMEDMRAAGLNPILAGKLGGASTPGGSMPVLHDAVTPALQTALQFYQADADVDLKKANEALISTRNVLSEQLVPGAKAISTVTEQVANLAKAVTNIIGKDRPGYEEMLQSLQLSMTDWFEKAAKVGADTEKVIVNVINNTKGLSQDAINYLQDSYDDFKDSVRMHNRGE